MSTDKLCVVEVITGNALDYCAVAVITVFETESVSKSFRNKKGLLVILVSDWSYYFCY
jgi:hypothetical protein